MLPEDNFVPDSWVEKQLSNTLMMSNKPYYSEKNAAKFGYAVYRLPDGKEVKVSECVVGDAQPTIIVDDLKLVGENGKFVRNIDGPAL